MRFIIALLLFCTCASAQKNQTVVSIEDAKVHYTFEAAKHIIWPNEAKISQFRFGYIGKSTNLVSAFINKSKATLIRGKSVVFEQVNQYQPQTDYHLVFVDHRHISDIEDINKLYPNALIVADGKISHNDQQISLLSINKGKTVEISMTLNRRNIVARGFRISNNLLEFAGSKDDITEQLKDKERALNNMLSEIHAQQQKLDNLTDTLQQSQQALVNAKSELAAKTVLLTTAQKKLDQLKQQSAEAEQQLAKQNQQIEQQKNKIINTEHYLQRQQALLAQLKSAIRESKQLIAQQEHKLDKQSSELDDKAKKISQQNILLIVITLVIFVVLILSYFVLRLSLMRKKANKELKSLNEQLYELATTDGLTQLYNRRHFVESAQKQLNQLHRTKQPSALMMLDIDYFKQVNDTYGHDAGDQAIMHVAQVIRENTREYDIAGRLGGEEFAMFLVSCDFSVAASIAERLRERIEQTRIKHRDIYIDITISVGLTKVEDDDSDLHAILNRADQGLYQAKNSGRNRVVIV